MQYTLIEIVQEILSALDSDEVNSISDTTESLQVASIVKNCYWDIISSANLPKQHTLFELVATADASQPVLMTMPAAQLTLQWLKYNQATTADASPRFEELTFVPTDTFLTRMYHLSTEDDNTNSFDFTLPSGDTVTIIHRTDTHPSCYTTWDDHTLLFDSYNSSEDTTLQAEKTLAYGERLPTWTDSDTFVPDLPPKQFTILRNEAKSTAFAELKQSQNQNSEKKARRGWISMQKNKRNINNPQNELNRLPDYGRKR